jgi:DNA repair exonuclease SbcCD ATPase subunit
MQSPQKLRERMQNEQSAINSAQASLQDELSRIGDELTATPSRVGSVRSSGHIRSKSNASSPPFNMDLAQRVLKLEGQLSQTVEQFNTSVQRFQNDIASSLTVAESKNKKLDELYKEANGENEALYARFNDELNRILKAVKSGDGVEEMKTQLKEHQEELAKLRRENARLKREGAGLRAQLRE